VAVVEVGAVCKRADRASAALLPLALLGVRTAAVANAAIALKATIGIAQLYVLTLYFQDVLGLSPLETGVRFVPMTVASVVAAIAAGRLVTRLDVKPTALLGLALLAGGLLLMAQLAVAGSIAIVVAGMILGEAGFMTAEVPLTVASTTSLSEDVRGLAAGMLNTSLQLGNALGLGIIVAVITARATAVGGASPDGEALVEGFRYGLLTGVGFVALAALLVARSLERRGVGR
jgi:DHA2 family lincomycin resistance protein-like MFS transporter